MKTDKLSRRGVPICIILAAGLLVFADSGAGAQTLTTGVLSGHVESEAGESLANVLVTLEDTGTGSRVTLTADRSGRFRIAGLAPEEYVLTVERIGFVPQRVSGLRVRAERELSLVVALTPADASPTATEDRRGPPARAPIGAGQEVPAFAIHDLSGRSRTFGAATRLTSIFDGQHGAEGLPGWLSAGAVDGTWFRPASLSPDGRSVGSIAFTTAGIEAAHAYRNPVDTEWSGTAGALLSGYTLRGSTRSRGEVSGQWSGDALAIASLEGDPAFSDARGRGLVRGSLNGGSTLFSLGVEARREQLPISAAWAGTDGAQQLVGAEPGLAAYVVPVVPTTTAVAGFGRLDWIMSERHTIQFGVHLAAQPSIDVVEASGAVQEQEGRDLVAGASMLSRLGESTVNELRVSLAGTERALVADADALPLTGIADERVAFGGSPLWSKARDAYLRVGDAIHYRHGVHTVKIGGEVGIGAHRYDRTGEVNGEYAFGGVDEFLAGTGVLARIEGDASSADWNDRTYAAFMQDRFTVARQVEVLAGIRVERQTPSVSVTRDEEWERLTGLANDEMDQSPIRLSPRASAVWDIGRSGQWFVSAAGGIYYDRLDPLLLAGWQTDDGTLRVRRVAGTIGWPPAVESGGEALPRLTMLGSNFEAPRTLRMTAGMSVPPLFGTEVRVSGVVRRTENLPRRTDLNLAPAPPTRDQHGRVVFGTLLKQGGLVMAEAGSNRRFSTYDEVAAIVSDGSSRHWSISVALDRGLFDGVDALARYTFARTTDNWFGARAGGWSTSAPSGLGSDAEWLDATSDFDVPHRFTAGLVWTAPATIRLGVAYRAESGRPFTPAFEPNVDVNGDGLAGNDPAFVDESIAGTETAISRWPCLRESAGGFARRNSCRASAVHGLDLTATIPFVRFGGAAASVRIDVFDALESAPGMPDAALFLIDPEGDLTVDPAASVVAVPLVSNEDFGRELEGRRSGRTIRFGLSINW